MTKAIAVIGANYGDEGKGATVHSLAKNLNINDVVRFNGGSQAGHTVCVNGNRQVFHSYGSATLLGAKTWFTEDMMVNPIYMFEEWSDLSGKGFPPLIRVDPNCIVVTPWDIAVNQFLELGRGGGRHGSCGQGINEAMNRHLKGPRIIASDLVDSAFMNTFSSFIQAWYKLRIKEETEKGSFLNFEEPQYLDYISSSDLLGKAMVKFLQYSSAFARTGLILDKNPTYNVDTVLFEGAQGLLLDQDDAEHFPHVTRSSTGLKNVLKACVDGVELSEVHYVTRPFLTRHGAGPILKGIPCEDLWDQGQDKTNARNKFQESIRYAHLDWGLLRDRIEKDVAQCTVRPEVKLSLTWMDSIHNQERYKFYWHGEVVDFDATHTEQILALIRERMGFEVVPIDGRKG